MRARPLCVIGDDDGIRRASAIVDATGDASVQARCSASLVLALAEAGELHEAKDRARHARRVIDALPDVAQKAAPLADLARALDLSGQHEEAVEAFLQALNAARHAGRYAVFKVMQKGAGIASGITPCRIAESICRASSLWTATA